MITKNGGQGEKASQQGISLMDIDVIGKKKKKCEYQTNVRFAIYV